jgi:NADPH-dependent glutamate synthase beta subunit-like oxidoreductase
LTDGKHISANNKRVVVIGGGDTGADCIGTSLRHGCKSLVNLELLDQPPNDRGVDNPWPLWPKILRTDYAHAEAIAKFGADPRVFATTSQLFTDDGHGRVAGIMTKRIKWVTDKGGKVNMRTIRGSELLIEADLVLLALGFLGPETYVSEPLGVTLDARTNYAAAHGAYATNVSGVFAAGDCRRGQSLVRSSSGQSTRVAVRRVPSMPI